MKGKGAPGVLVLTALLCCAPISMKMFPGNSGVPTLTATAVAAELAIPSHRGANRYALHSRLQSYDLYCGGPYAHAGFNGGTYWGGPWMDLACYRGIR